MLRGVENEGRCFDVRIIIIIIIMVWDAWKNA